MIVPNARPGILAGALMVVTLSLGEFNLTWMLHTPLTKTLPVGLADSYASMRLEVASAYTLVFFVMIIPLLVAMQMFATGVKPAGRANERARAGVAVRSTLAARPSATAPARSSRSRSRSHAARRWCSSGPRAAARPRCCASSPGSRRPTPAGACCSTAPT